MNKHIEHLIEAYVSGQLSPRKARRVLNHVRVCDRCMEILASKEQEFLAVDNILREKPYLPAQDEERLWLNIVSDLNTPTRQQISSHIFAPILLCVIIIGMPFVLVTNQKASAHSVGAAGTVPASESNAVALAPTGTLISAEAVELTSAPLTGSEQNLLIATIPAPENIPSTRK